MKKVFLVDSNPIQVTVWENFLDGSDWELYTLKGLDDFGFRCKDFCPDIIVLGKSVGSREGIAIVKTYASEIPVAVIGSTSEESGVLTFEAPFKPTEIGIILNNLLAKSKGI